MRSIKTIDRIEAERPKYEHGLPYYDQNEIELAYEEFEACLDEYVISKCLAVKHNQP